MKNIFLKKKHYESNLGSWYLGKTDYTFQLLSVISKKNENSMEKYYRIKFAQMCHTQSSQVNM